MKRLSILIAAIIIAGLTTLACNSQFGNGGASSSGSSSSTVNENKPSAVVNKAEEVKTAAENKQPNKPQEAEQTAFFGQYVYQQKIDEGRNTLDLIFEIKDNNQTVYRNIQDSAETQKRNGTWSWDDAKKQLTVIMPPVPDGYQGQNVKLTFVFQPVGKNLKLVSDLPYKQGSGEIYEKL